MTFRILGALSLLLTALLVPAPVFALDAPGDGSYVVLDPGPPFAEGELIQLQIESGRLAFSAGCNDLSGTADWTGGTLVLSEVMSTKMACDPDATAKEQWTIDLLTSTPGWSVADGVLTLTSGTTTLNAIPVEVMATSGSTLTGTTWRLIRVGKVTNGVRTTKKTALTPRPALRVHGRRVSFQTGCNSASAKVTIGARRLKLGPVAMTLVGCSGAAARTERAVTRVLRGQVSYRQAGDRLILRRGDRILIYRAR